MAGALDPDGEATAVQLPMMKATQSDEIIETGVTAVGPVLNVMGIHIARLATAGKAAGFVPNRQRAAQGGRHCSCPATDIEYIAPPVFQYGNQAGVAGQAARRLRGDPRLFIQVALRGARCGARPVAQGMYIDMQHHLAALTALEALQVGGIPRRSETMLRHGDQCIRAALPKIDAMPVGGVVVHFVGKRSGSPPDCSNGAPTDPDVRNSRIRLLKPSS